VCLAENQKILLNENERISKITIRHKLKKRSSTFIAVLHFSHSKEFIKEKEYIIVSNGPYKKHRGQYFYTVQEIGEEFTIWYNAHATKHILLIHVEEYRRGNQEWTTQRHL
jgi:hypothetical protein